MPWNSKLKSKTLARSTSDLRSGFGQIFSSQRARIELEYDYSAWESVAIVLAVGERQKEFHD